MFLLALGSLLVSGWLAGGAPAQTLDGEEEKLLRLINQYRAQHRSGPLALSPALTSAARWMSGDMSAKDYFPGDHVDSLGRSAFARMAAFHYSFRSARAENLAAGHERASATFQQWKNSSGHNENMLNPAFKVIGIGRAYTARSVYGWYWTADFGSYADAVPR